MRRLHFVLVIQDDFQSSARLRHWLRQRGYAVEIARNYTAACGSVTRRPPDLLLVGDVEDVLTLDEFLAHARLFCPAAKLMDFKGTDCFARLERFLMSNAAMSANRTDLRAANRSAG